MQHKKLSSFSLACLMATSVLPIFASEPSTGNQKVSTETTNEVPLYLEVIDSAPNKRFSVAVPTQLPIVMDMMGNTTVATNARIENKSTDPIKVIGIDVTPGKGWSLGSYASDIGGMEKDKKIVGVSINNCTTTADGFAFDQDQFRAIPVGGNMGIQYDVKIPRRRKASVAPEKIASSTFIIGWADGSAMQTQRLNKSSMDFVAKKLTGTVAFHAEKYSGALDASNVYDLSVDGDETVVCVVNGQNADIYAEHGVKAPVNSTDLFRDYNAAAFDLSGLRTSDVTDMSSMFFGTKTAELDLTGFNTAHVTSMYAMFGDSRAQTINMKSCDLSAVENTEYMFGSSRATRIVCHDIAARDKMIASGQRTPTEHAFVLG